MKSSIIEKLTSKIRLPLNVIELPLDEDWLIAERVLGVTLPEDYKIILNTFGTGLWFDCIFPFNPVANDWRSRLCFKVYNICEMYENNKNEISEIRRYKFYPDVDGLLPFARTHDALTLFWDMNNWGVVLLDAVYFEKLNMGFSDMLFELGNNNNISVLLKGYSNYMAGFEPMHFINRTFNKSRPYDRGNPRN